jgi:hypothetical protein
MSEWISVKEDLPEIPEGKHAVPVIGAMFDRFDFNNGQGGYHVDHGLYGEHATSLKPVFLFIQFSGGEYEPLDESYSNDMGIQLTHWMYEPSTGELEALQQEEKADDIMKARKEVEKNMKRGGITHTYNHEDGWKEEEKKSE